MPITRLIKIFTTVIMLFVFKYGTNVWAQLCCRKQIMTNGSLPLPNGNYLRTVLILKFLFWAKNEDGS